MYAAGEGRTLFSLCCTTVARARACSTSTFCSSSLSAPKFSAWAWKGLAFTNQCAESADVTGMLDCGLPLTRIGLCECL